MGFRGKPQFGPLDSTAGTDYFRCTPPVKRKHLRKLTGFLCPETGDKECSNMASKPNIAKLLQEMGLLTAILLSFGVAQAQEAQELPLHPHSTIKLELTFHGPGADKITAIYASMQTDSQVSPDQAGFLNNFSGDFRLISPGVFDAEFTVPDTALSGVYNLPALDVRGNGIKLNYKNGVDFQLHTFRVENPNMFTKPPVTIKLTGSGPTATSAPQLLLMTP
jgi:hypothetical protein